MIVDLPPHLAPLSPLSGAADEREGTSGSSEPDSDVEVALAADTQRFDGMWQTTVSCSAARDALGYSFRFVSTVKDGVFHGVHGAAGEPGSLQIDGKIGADGMAKLYANGRTGSKEYVPGRDTPRGTEYGYNIDAKFEGATGTGTRVEGRPCTLQFEKQ